MGHWLSPDGVGRPSWHQRLRLYRVHQRPRLRPSWHQRARASRVHRRPSRHPRPRRQASTCHPATWARKLTRHPRIPSPTWARKSHRIPRAVTMPGFSSWPPGPARCFRQAPAGCSVQRKARTTRPAMPASPPARQTRQPRPCVAASPPPRQKRQTRPLVPAPQWLPWARARVSSTAFVFRFARIVGAEVFARTGDPACCDRKALAATVR